MQKNNKNLGSLVVPAFFEKGSSAVAIIKFRNSQQNLQQNEFFVGINIEDDLWMIGEFNLCDGDQCIQT